MLILFIASVKLKLDLNITYFAFVLLFYHLLFLVCRMRGICNNIPGNQD